MIELSCWTVAGLDSLPELRWRCQEGRWGRGKRNHPLAFWAAWSSQTAWWWADFENENYHFILLQFSPLQRERFHYLVVFCWQGPHFPMQSHCLVSPRNSEVGGKAEGYIIIFHIWDWQSFLVCVKFPYPFGFWWFVKQAIHSLTVRNILEMLGLLLLLLVRFILHPSSLLSFNGHVCFSQSAVASWVACELCWQRRMQSRIGWVKSRISCCGGDGGVMFLGFEFLSVEPGSLASYV